VYVPPACKFIQWKNCIEIGFIETLLAFGHLIQDEKYNYEVFTARACDEE
jgi:hypothetical protein